MTSASATEVAARNASKGNKAQATAKPTKTPKPVDKSKVKAITPNGRLILAALAKAKGGMTRKQLRGVTSINKGYAKLMGAASKADSGFGKGGDGLQPRGLVACTSTRPFTYTLTAKGKAELANSTAPVAKAEKVTK